MMSKNKMSKRAESIVSGLLEVLKYKKGKAKLRTTVVNKPESSKSKPGAQLLQPDE